ncbi:IS5 family transposase, partial [Escherichia coli]|nr:IS5 family transposase [Escherichia coli]MDD9064692.1 IS5 family transposase [Escherichia coli]
PAYGPQNDVTLKMPAFEWVHVQLHQQKGMISLSPPTICNSAVDSNTHEIICADLSLNNVTDSEAFPGLIRQTHRKIRAASADGAYDTRLCHDELRRKKISALIPPRKGAGYWPGEYADRNRAVANQRMTGSNARWKWTTDYNRRSIAETAMYRVKQLFGGSLTLRDYDGQVAEAMALVRALNKMTKAGMPESVRIA